MKIKIHNYNVSIVIELEAQTEEEKNSIKNLIDKCKNSSVLGESNNESWVQVICNKDKACSPDINKQLEDEGYYPV